MPDISLTSEQQRIIEHPLHKHASVLAIAGSGKTTTMVHRVRHLVMDINQDARHIRSVDQPLALPQEYVSVEGVFIVTLWPPEEVSFPHYLLVQVLGVISYQTPRFNVKVGVGASNKLAQPHPSQDGMQGVAGISSSERQQKRAGGGPAPA